jgi:hypothetical protein
LACALVFELLHSSNAQEEDKLDNENMC